MGQCYSTVVVILFAVAGYASCDPTDIIRNEQLLTFGTVSGTAAITVTPQEGAHTQIHSFPPGANISPACSTADRSSRCRRVYRDAIGSDKFIMLSALDNAVGVMSFRYSDNELVREGVSVLSISNALQIEQCVPLEIIHFNDRPMVLCLDRQYLRSCNIKVNRSDVTQSSLIHCIQLHFFPTAIPFAQFSNFVYFPDIEQVIVVIQRSMYGIRYDRRDLRPYVELDDSTCDHLYYAGDHNFYISCRSGKVFVYNTDTESLDPYLPQEDGVPVPCSSSLFTLVQRGNDTVVRHSSGLEMTIDGMRFSSGMCSPAGVLYITDHLGDITVVNATLRSHHHLGVRSHHLEVFDEDYAIVSTNAPSKSILYKSLERITERNGESQAVGVISSLTIKRMASTTPTSTTPPRTPPNSSSIPSVDPPNANVLLSPGGWAGVVIGIAVLVALSIAFAMLAIWRCKKIKDPQGARQRVPTTAADATSNVEQTAVSHTHNDDAAPKLGAEVVTASPEVVTASADSSTGERDANPDGACADDSAVPLSTQEVHDGTVPTECVV